MLREEKKPIPSLESALKYSLRTLLKTLSKILATNQDKLKFEALNILSVVLPDVPSEVNIFFCYKTKGDLLCYNFLYYGLFFFNPIFNLRLCVNSKKNLRVKIK